MRRLALALVMLSSPMSAVPSQAQWWGPGGPGPCDGPCRPWAGGGWAGGPWGRPVMVMRPRPWVRRWAFGPGGFGWRPAFRPWRYGWRRVIVEPRREAVEVVPAYRRHAPFFAMRAAAAAVPAPARTQPTVVRPVAEDARAAPPAFRHRAPSFAVRAATPPAVRFVPTRTAQTAVAVMPTAALPPVREVPHAVIRSTVLSTAAVVRRARHLRSAEPAAFHVSPRPRVDDAPPRPRADDAAPTPATLRSDAPPSSPATPAAPASAGGAQTDVPAAPLD